jgi:hypothetical protein
MSEAPRTSQLLVYRAENGAIKIDVRFEDETVWLTQQLMAELFQTTQQNISLHLQNIYEEGELEPEATHKESLSVRTEGNREVSRTSAASSPTPGGSPTNWRSSARRANASASTHRSSRIKPSDPTISRRASRPCR